MHNWLKIKWPQIWYSNQWGYRLITWLLLPFSLLFLLLSTIRRFAYKMGLRQVVQLNVPVIVVGNITVGGTGKTSTVIAITQYLQEQGYRPGILSRGYGSDNSAVRFIEHDSIYDSKMSDEALLMARKTKCPAAVCRNRVKAAKALLEKMSCNILISDDGLQHYSLGRDIEIAVIDGQRRFGNGYCLPAGPCRERTSRLDTVDFVITKGKPRDNEFGLQYAHDAVYAVTDINQTVELAILKQQAQSTLHALAAIGHPEHFFGMLRSAGLDFKTTVFPDHHPLSMNDINVRPNTTVLMTEKDAVKVAHIANEQHWAVRLTSSFSGDLLTKLLKKVQECQHESATG